MAQLVASIVARGRMPCNSRCVGYTKIMSMDVSRGVLNNTTYVGGRQIGNVHRRLTGGSPLHLTCRAVCCCCFNSGAWIVVVVDFCGLMAIMYSHVGVDH